jgi:hypothetical protein
MGLTLLRGPAVSAKARSAAYRHSHQAMRWVSTMAGTHDGVPLQVASVEQSAATTATITTALTCSGVLAGPDFAPLRLGTLVPNPFCALHRTPLLVLQTRSTLLRYCTDISIKEPRGLLQRLTVLTRQQEKSLCKLGTFSCKDRCLQLPGQLPTAAAVAMRNIIVRGI